MSQMLANCDWEGLSDTFVEHPKAMTDEPITQKADGFFETKFFIVVMASLRVVYNRWAGHLQQNLRDDSVEHNGYVEGIREPVQLSSNHRQLTFTFQLRIPRNGFLSTIAAWDFAFRKPTRSPWRWSRFTISSSEQRKFVLRFRKPAHSATAD